MMPEVLFDMDPGHYIRSIKSVGLRIPCVVGPYTSLKPESRGILIGRYAGLPLFFVQLNRETILNQISVFVQIIASSFQLSQVING